VRFNELAAETGYRSVQAREYPRARVLNEYPVLAVYLVHDPEQRHQVVRCELGREFVSGKIQIQNPEQQESHQAVDEQQRLPRHSRTLERVYENDYAQKCPQDRNCHIAAPRLSPKGRIVGPSVPPQQLSLAAACAEPGMIAVRLYTC